MPEKDLAMIYALADLKTEGHKDLALGDMSITSYQALCSVLGDPDVIKNDKTKKETKNTIAEQIKDAYGFFFPKSA